MKTPPLIFLVSCVKSKLDAPAPAEDLYTSIWFRAARQFVERQNAQWFILSAKYGLVSPDTVIEPYEQTLNKMDVAARKAWSADLYQQSRGYLGLPESRIVFLAGLRYREFIIDRLAADGYRTDAPLARLGIGSQVRWLQTTTHYNTGEGK